MSYTGQKKLRKYLRPEDKYASGAKRQLWRVIDGAVRDCFMMHPDYVSPSRQAACRRSIVKRVIAQVIDNKELVEKSASGPSGDARGS